MWVCFYIRSTRQTFLKSLKIDVTMLQSSRYRYTSPLFIYVLGLIYLWNIFHYLLQTRKIKRKCRWLLWHLLSKQPFQTKTLNTTIEQTISQREFAEKSKHLGNFRLIKPIVQWEEIKRGKDGQADAGHHRGGGAIHQPGEGPGTGPQVSGDTLYIIFSDLNY